MASLHATKLELKKNAHFYTFPEKCPCWLPSFMLDFNADLIYAWL